MTLDSNQSTIFEMAPSNWAETEKSSSKSIKREGAVFFDYRGVMHPEFFPESEAVNKEYHLSVVHRMRQQIRQKRVDMLKKIDGFWTNF